VSKLLAARYAKGVPPGEARLFSEPLANVLPPPGGGGAGAPAPPPAAADEPMADGGEGAPPAPAPAPALPYAFNFSGGWALDKAASEPLTKLLEAMEVPWALRRIAAGAETTSEVAHTPTRLTVRDKTRVMGTVVASAQEMSLDGQPTDNVGSDKKVTVTRAVATRAWDEVPAGTDVGALLGAGGPPPPAALEGGALPPAHGPGSGCLVSLNVLPDGGGESRDERHLLAPNRMRLITTFSKGGVERVRLTRFLVRWDEARGARVADDAAPDIVPVFAAAAAAAAVGSPREPPPPPASPAPARGAGGDGGGAGAAGGSPAPPLASPPPPLASPPPAGAGAAPLSPPATAAAAGGGAPPLSPQAPLPPVQLVAALGAQPAPGGYAFDRWIPDEAAPACFASGRPFTAFLRRHHCRCCGQAFCDAESPARLPLAHFTSQQLRTARLVGSDAVRLCNGCASPAVFTVSRVPAAGGRVTLTGAQLGTADLVAAGRVDVVVGGLGGGRALRARGVACPEDHTALSFLMPPGVGLRTLRVTVEGRSSAEVPFWYPPPALAGAEAPDTDGGPTLVRGENLGEKVEDAAALAWAFGGEAVRVVGVAPGGVLLALPPGAGAGHALTVAARAPPAATSAALPGVDAAGWGGPLAGAALQLAYAPPALFSGRLAPGALTVYGRSLGARAEDIRVTVAGVALPPAAVALAVPHAKLSVALSGAAAAAVAAAKKEGAAVRVEVAVAGLDAEEPLLVK